MLSLAEQTLCPFSVTCIFPITRTALISEAGEKSVHMSPTSIPSAADCIICADYCAIIGLNQKDLENQGILA